MGFQGPYPFHTHEVKVDAEALTIHPLSDIHVGAGGHDEARLERKLAEILDAGPEHRVLLLGDLADIAIKDSVASTYGAKTPHWEQDRLVELFKPLADRIDLILPGNHERRIQRTVGLDYAAQFATMIGRPEVYRPHATALKYYFRLVNHSASATGTKPIGSFTLFCHHGYGGGRTIGPKMKRVVDLRQIYADADAYLMGHVHEQMGRQGVCVSGWPPKAKRQLFVVTGCYLGPEGYSSDGAYDPPATGSPVLHVWVEVTKDKKTTRASVTIGGKG